jgi:D-lyxose ketol-isomerase
MKAYGKHRESGEEQEILLEAPVQVQIFPNVYHSFTALTDCQFIEFNSIEDHKKDTYYPQESVSLSS